MIIRTEYKVLFADGNYEPHARTLTTRDSALDLVSRIARAPDAEVLKVLARRVGTWTLVAEKKGGWLTTRGQLTAPGKVSEYVVSFHEKAGHEPHNVVFGTVQAAVDFLTRIGEEGGAEPVRVLRREVGPWAAVELKVARPPAEQLSRPVGLVPHEAQRPWARVLSASVKRAVS